MGLGGLADDRQSELRSGLPASVPGTVEAIEHGLLVRKLSGGAR
jgi:hypothetical protein